MPRKVWLLMLLVGLVVFGFSALFAQPLQIADFWKGFLEGIALVFVGAGVVALVLSWREKKAK